MKLTVGSLFSGIGGIELGLEQTGGFETKWQVEINPFAQKVLRKHWPNAELFEDVKTFPPQPMNKYKVDLLCGGFPCQDVSNARTTQEEGPQGLSGEKSGLWFEFERIIRMLRPRWVLIENVGALNIRGLGTVLWGLASKGYACEWATISAASMGAPHIRKRLFIVAVQDPDGTGLEGHVGSILAQPRGWRQYADAARSDWGNPTPRICRGADGILNRVDRLRSLGNAVVPAVPRFIGERILRVNREIK